MNNTPALNKRRAIMENIIKDAISQGKEAAEYVEQCNFRPATRRAYWKGFNDALKMLANKAALTPELWGNFAQKETPKRKAAELRLAAPKKISTSDAARLHTLHAMSLPMRQTFDLIAETPDISGPELAEILQCPKSTAYWYIRQLRLRLNLHDNHALRIFAERAGLI